MGNRNQGIMDIHSYLESVPPHIPLLKFIFSSCSPDVVLDIGACEGEDSIRYKLLFPSARIIAFEPIPSNLTRIQHNLQRFDISGIEVMPVALAASDGNAELHISSGQPSGVPGNTDWDYGNKSSSLLKPSALMGRFHNWLRFDSTLTVPTRQLDSLLAERGIESVDFIHMDVQGAEMLILSGSTKALPSVACLWLEVGTNEIYEGQPPAADTQSFLESLGFIRIMECLNEGSGDHFYINPKRLRCLKVNETVTHQARA